MPHKRRKGKTWRKVEVANSEHIGKVLNVRCCCKPQNITGVAKVTFDTVLDLYGDELAIKRHA